METGTTVTIRNRPTSVTPAPKVDDARPEALAGDGLIAFGVARQVVLPEHQGQQDHHKAHGIGAGLAVIGRPRATGALIDHGGDDIHIACQTHKSRHFERFHGLDENQQREAAKRGQSHAQGDAAKGPQGTCAGHHRRLLERGVRGAQDRRHQEEGERHKADALDQHHAPERIDVQRLRLVQEALDQFIHRAGTPQQQEPCHHMKHMGHAQRDDGGEKGELAARRIGALHDQRLHGADENRDHR
jgi:hypothetical protein